MIFESQKIIDDDKYIKMSISIDDDSIFDKDTFQKILDDWIGFIFFVTLAMSYNPESWMNVVRGLYNVIEVEKEKLKKKREDYDGTQ